MIGLCRAFEFIRAHYLHPKHLHHLVAEVVDDLHGDATTFRPVEGSGDVHRTYISDLERGARNPTITVVDKLATALGVTPGRLLD